jgi:hypothetical protein
MIHVLLKRAELEEVDHIHYFHWNKALAADESTEQSLFDLDCVAVGIERVEEP